MTTGDKFDASISGQRLTSPQPDLIPRLSRVQQHPSGGAPPILWLGQTVRQGWHIARFVGEPRVRSVTCGRDTGSRCQCGRAHSSCFAFLLLALQRVPTGPQQSGVHPSRTKHACTPGGEVITISKTGHVEAQSARPNRHGPIGTAQSARPMRTAKPHAPDKLTGMPGCAGAAARPVACE